VVVVVLVEVLVELRWGGEKSEKRESDRLLVEVLVGEEVVVEVVKVVVVVVVLVVVEELLLLVREGTLTLVEEVDVTNLGKKEVMGRDITKGLTKRRRRGGLTRLLRRRRWR